MSTKHLKPVVSSLALGAATSLTAYHYFRYVEPHRLTVERVTIPVKNLPPQLHGFTIAQLSDFHYRPHTTLEFIQHAIDEANALQPDLFALTGDYINKDAANIFEVVPILAQLRAPYGVYSVLGNHDVSRSRVHYGQTVRYGFEHVGLPILSNQHVRLDNGLVIAGLDETYNDLPDLRRALTGVSADARVLLLMHQPDYADVAARDPRVFLQLSGHTHGGQMNLPYVRPFYLPYYGRKYIRGLHRVQDMWLYVNRGIGLAYYGPMRINCPPEITLLTLVQGEGV